MKHGLRRRDSTRMGNSRGPDGRAHVGKNHGAGSVAPADGRRTQMVLFRRQLGDVLRGERMRRGMTLRQLSSEARISLGYISEIERGQKEASSELLSSLCDALDVALSDVLREVSDAVALEEAASALAAAGLTPLEHLRARTRAGEVVASAA